MADHGNERVNDVHPEQYLEYFGTNADGDAKVTLDLIRSPLVLLSYSATQYVQTTSAIFRRQFGVGSAAWRMLVVLFRNPESTSKDVAQYVRMDKAAVSRTLSSLMDQGYVRCNGNPEDERVKVWSLSDSGLVLHDRMLNVSAQIYERVLTGLSNQEIDSLRHCLQVLSRRVDQLPEFFPEQLLHE